MKCPCIACHRRGFWRGRLPGEGAHPELQELAPRIASAQIDRVRMQRARHQLLSRALRAILSTSDARERNCNKENATPSRVYDFRSLFENALVSLVYLRVCIRTFKLFRSACDVLTSL